MIVLQGEREGQSRRLSYSQWRWFVRLGEGVAIL